MEGEISHTYSKSSLHYLFPICFFLNILISDMAAKLISTGFRHSTLPVNYVRPISDRPRLSEVSELEDFPLIDLSSTDRSRLVQQIHQACARFGFFQVPIHTDIFSIYTFSRLDNAYGLLH